MKVKITPSRLLGTIVAPPSKSMAHRYIICAFLSDGETIIKNVDLSKDIKATMESISALGKSVEYSDGTLIIKGDNKREKELYVNESGSTLRFLIPLALDGEETIFRGAKRLFERPLSIYEELFSKNGIEYEKGEDYFKVKGKLTSGTYEVRGDVSSQFITGLLFALSSLSGDSEIKVLGEFESKSYVDMTLSAMAEFGVNVEFKDNTYKIKGGQKYMATSITVPGDYSNAAFFEALNLMGHDVKVLGLDENSNQGDRVYGEYFRKIKEGKCTLSLKDCPDLAPILFAVTADVGEAEFTETKRLKIKESDRATAMATELSKLGAKIIVNEDDVIIEKANLTATKEEFSSHNDHRIAMAISVLLTKYGGEISGAEAVNKSLPDFYKMLEELGAKVEYTESERTN